MDIFQIAIMLILLSTIAMQAAQFYNFSETRSQVVEGFYIVIIIALMIQYDFFPWLTT